MIAMFRGVLRTKELRNQLIRTKYLTKQVLRTKYLAPLMFFRLIRPRCTEVQWLLNVEKNSSAFY